MCGVAGLLSSRTRVDGMLLTAMTDRMITRGPDSAGCWIAADARIGLGHRRLAILDLSPSGHQPMVSACGRYVIAFNGEIYNFRDLARDLDQAGKAPAWRGHSDTEVLLAAIAAWGVRSAVQRAAGMFAFAVWDNQARTLTLARDRFGEKPLYYGWTAAGFAFASTLAPIRCLPGFANPVAPQALAGLVARAYVPTPLSIYRRIYKLPPGCLLTVAHDADGAPMDEAPIVGAAGPVRLCRWFAHADEVLAGAADPIADADEALDRLEAALGAAVARQMVADVPVGTFLSGGIDSSLITAMAAARSDGPLRTFSIGFAEAGYDEAPHARAIAAHLGTDHHELYVSAAEARAVIPSLPAMYDEPFADSSQIPTFLVSQFARAQATVALTGDAGDELFGGYNRHQQFPRVWRRVAPLPPALRRGVLGVAGMVPPALWNALCDLTGRRRSREFGRNARRGIGIIGAAGGFDALFDSFLDDWHGLPSPLAHPVARSLRLGTDPALAGLPLELAMMQADAVTYLPDDILTKVDRAGMAVGLETRIPFLDPGVTAVAARIAPELKFQGGTGKHILKQLLHRHVPRDLFDRPKAGFAVPVGTWLKGPLRDWAEDLLSDRALADGGLFAPPVVRARWQRHLSGREDATQALWSVLMVQAWSRSAGDAPPHP